VPDHTGRPAPPCPGWSNPSPAGRRPSGALARVRLIPGLWRRGHRRPPLQPAPPYTPGYWRQALPRAPWRSATCAPSSGACQYRCAGATVGQARIDPSRVAPSDERPCPKSRPCSRHSVGQPTATPKRPLPASWTSALEHRPRPSTLAGKTCSGAPERRQAEAGSHHPLRQATLRTTPAGHQPIWTMTWTTCSCR
jgi:hypothetical protein